MQKYTLLAALAALLCACQQEEIIPNGGVPVIGGDVAPVTLSGDISYNTDYIPNAGDELRSVNYDVGFPINGSFVNSIIRSAPSPFFEGENTTLTCIIKSDDHTKPVSIFDIEWKNTDSRNVKLNHKAITLTQGTDLTQGNWYIMAFFTTNGRASGQTFSFDKNTGNLTIASPTNNQGNNYDDAVFDTEMTYNPNSTSSPYSIKEKVVQRNTLPAFFASAWQKLTVEVIDNNTAAKINNTLVLMPQGSLIGIDETYLVAGRDVITTLGGLDTRHYAPAWPHNLSDIVEGWHRFGLNPATGTYTEWFQRTGVTGPEVDTRGYTLRELIGGDYENSSVTEASQVSLSLPGFTTPYGTYHLLPTGVAPVEGQYTMTFTSDNPLYRPIPNTDVTFTNAYGTVTRPVTTVDNWYTFTFNNPAPQTHRPSAVSKAVGSTRFLWVYSSTDKLYNAPNINNAPATVKWSHNSTNTFSKKAYSSTGYKFRYFFSWDGNYDIYEGYAVSPVYFFQTSPNEQSETLIPLNGGCYRLPISTNALLLPHVGGLERKVGISL